ncbi:murein L,D-transpeptidase YafK [Silvimonas terrae]|uniref:Murein L,D-transpeptidase YafK n=1 Tax=Silvimonas terrae TaxID=300266 RepID=A0A840RNJ8_9NEIS|nr:L,D-transpeptidase family protein [Silvimonas terrae]MBB5193641.1 murein L,D-transpeptidase YafK [Silvimonas terrae]
MTRTINWSKLILSLLALLLLAPAAQPRMPIVAPYQLHPLQDIKGNATQGSPEQMIVAAIDAIRDNRMADARATVDALLAKEPNYHLAYLLSGDLYAMQAGQLATMGGAAPAGTADKLEDLRREAMVRLRREASPPPVTLLPAQLVSFSDKQKYAILVDAAASRLFVFQNDNGVPKYVTDHYVTVGKLGTEKVREGDQRTPLGVYFVDSHMTRPQLDKTFGQQADLYGVGAWPISYPNELDRREGKTGHGIWLHGSPAATYSRPPQASNGCVVLTNPELASVQAYLQIDVTPVVIVPRIDWLTTAQWQERHTAALTLIDRWRQSWQALNLPGYLNYYSKDFTNSDGQNLSVWARQKTALAQTRNDAQISLSNISLFTGGKDGMLVATFDQDYRSKALDNRMRKRLYWRNEDGGWRIVWEGAAGAG